MPGSGGNQDKIYGFDTKCYRSSRKTRIKIRIAKKVTTRKIKRVNSLKKVMKMIRIRILKIVKKLIMKMSKNSQKMARKM